MQKVRKPYVHDVVYALSQVIIQILVTGGGDAKEGGTGEVVSSHSIHPTVSQPQHQMCSVKSQTLEVNSSHSILLLVNTRRLVKNQSLVVNRSQ